MAQLRLALAQINPTVGDLRGNADLIRDRARRAVAEGAHLVAFPEMSLVGYPVEDLALRSTFVDASREALIQLAADLDKDGHGEVPVVVGYLDHAPHETAESDPARPLPQNCAAVLHRGEVVARYAKHHLPNYGVFDEYRIFAPGQDLTVVRVYGVDVAIAICEDLWQEGGPVALTRAAGAELLLVINGSPYEQDKDDTRLELVRRRAGQAGCALAYLNLVGGQDELVFDGDSVVVDTGGEVLARGPQFEESVVTVDLDLTSSTVDPEHTPAGVEHVNLGDDPVPTYAAEPATLVPRLEPVAEVWAALVLGLRDYVRKNGFRSVLLGMSGGIDSAVVATLAADALGGENVVGISNPSSYSSQHSKDDAAALAQALGADYRVIPIAPMVDAFQAGLSLTGVAEENLQARIRGVVWMGLSNQEGHLVLTNGNKSEVSVGYSTIYGDSVGGFAPIKDVPKTLVWQLARWRNEEAVRRGEKPPIPESSITKAPSAELSPGQVDQDSLPPYELLDPLLDLYVEEARGRDELITAGFDEEVVDRVVALVDRAEWKRRQGAPGPKISPMAFGRDRRLPITSRWREQDARSATAGGDDAAAATTMERSDPAAEELRQKTQRSDPAAKEP
ncbi:NAD+ synthase [Segeticoccus rhizosphaerae]|jgi:NAD+ synthase (glutamine-hydrolysing)|uniref:NAD+ synthase n=1 Tax=Segeticoccus rhizosphaerae TaxID=1104777 RepID=UPI0010BFDA0C|nr:MULTISPECIES: NAD+ synthase [Intrasporangiaceae]